MAVIQIKNLFFAYEGAAEPVLTGLSFNMDSSWRLGLVGRNGRGKTTLLKLMAGQLKGQFSGRGLTQAALAEKVKGLTSCGQNVNP